MTRALALLLLLSAPGCYGCGVLQVCPQACTVNGVPNQVCPSGP